MATDLNVILFQAQSQLEIGFCTEKISKSQNLSPIKNILKATSRISLSTAVVFLSSFLRNKIMAVFLGVSGIGIVSQLSNFVSLLNYFVPLGIPNGLSKFAAEKNVEEKENLQQLYSSSVNLVAYPTIVFSILIFVFSDHISFILLDSMDYSLYVKIISIAVPFVVMNSMMEGFLRGLKEINLYVKILIISNIVNLFVVIPMVIYWGIQGGIYGILTSYVIYVFVSYYYLKKFELIGSIRIFKTIDRKLLNNLIRVSLVLLVSGALFQLSLLILRRMIISEFGIFYNGIFQSVIGISINYFGFIFLSLSTYSFPTVSKLQEKSEIVSELNTNVRYIIMLMVPLIILLFVFRFFVISFLFSSEFGSSETLFTYQFLGDFFKALAWSIGIWLVPKMKLKDFVVLEIILNLNLVLIYFLLINVFGSNLEFVSVSYLLAYLIHFILNYMVSRKYLDYSLGKLNAKLLTMSLSFMIPLIVISKYNAIAGYFVVLPALIFWTYLTVGREDFEKIKSYLIAKVKDKS